MELKSGFVQHGDTRPRLAVVISHPIQHFSPLFRDLARCPDLDLKVFYCCDWGLRDFRDPGFGLTFKWDVPLLEGYDSSFLPIKNRPTDLSFFAIDNPSVSQALAEYSPTAVWIHGYSHKTSWRAYLWAVRNRKQVLYFGDSELLCPRSWKSRLLKRIVLPRFFRKCSAFLTIGDNNEDYYRHYGVPDSKLLRGAFPVDINRFQTTVSGLTPDDRRQRRLRSGLHPESFVIVFSGKLIDIKRPMDIVEVVDRLRNRLPHLQALMLGSGPLEQHVRSEIQKRGLEDRVILPGFINQSEMPVMLWLGDCLVMASEKDPHPLAVTEAMSVGNAVIASDRIGCVGPTDAARIGENTIGYPFGNIDELAKAICRLAESPDLLQNYRKRSIELSWTQDTQVMVGAVRKALGLAATADSRPESMSVPL